MSLLDILKQRKCFKLVCGAGNEDPQVVEKLVAVYAEAGANCFDLSASKNIVLAAKKGLARVIAQDHINEYFLNVSVGIAGDPHLRKAYIDPDLCRGCATCVAVCLQKAIDRQNNIYAINTRRCIGCGACAKVCPYGAISFTYEKKDLQQILAPLIDLGISSIELHANTSAEEEAYSQWQIISSIFPGILSLCIDRSHLGDIKYINRVKRFIAGRRDYTTIIQADGSPMSGSNDDYNTTLQAIASADIVQKAKLPVFILMSGGTNSKTTQMAKLLGVHAHGVSIGSYARKIIREYIDKDNFFEDKKAFKKAVNTARKLVNKSLKYL